MRIKVLPDTVINQIAAGEVVERPASVVRELVDNAIDAGASDVFVTLESGGHSRLSVRDDGCGMNRDEAILAFERHATSKVSAIEDLMTLSTLGFRGEALASIAAVSKIKLRTRRAEDDVGTEVIFRGGRLVNVQSCSWNKGTEIEVEHLFFNTPARRKFLKSPRSELARIRTWLAHSSLGRPGVRYRLVADGDEVLNLPPVTSLEERARQVFPADLMPISLRESGLAVEGMVSHPGQALSDASGLVIVVNGRLISDKLIMRAVREGYDSMLKDREYPVGYVSITMSPEDVDVNVHPQKSEVRFRRPDQIFAVVRGAVLTGVRSIKRPMALLHESAPGIATREEPSRIQYQPPTTHSLWGHSSVMESLSASRVDVVFTPAARVVPEVTSVERGEPYSYKPIAPTPQYLFDARKPQTFRFSDLRYIGQALECYLLCELTGRLVVVDMHAAHERVNYNKIRQERASGALVAQKLLIPEVLRLTEEQVVVLMEQSDVLRELAFEVTQQGIEEIVVHALPSILAHRSCASLLKEFAVEPVVAGWRERLEERIDHMAARLACHASVRSGDALTKHEAYALFAQLDEAELSGACPHGRPCVTEFSREAVERWFGRDR
jgi:DNA mismatch repair protein MutL